jgi:hypothetical protein
MASKSYQHIRDGQQRQDGGKPAETSQNPGARQSEFPVSRQGMNQESEHNKHNHPEQGAPKH